MLQESHENMGEHLIGSISDKHLFGLEPTKICDRTAQLRCPRIGIAEQVIAADTRDRCEHGIRRWVRTLVSVEL